MDRLKFQSLLLILVLIFSSASAATPAATATKILSGLFSSLASSVMKRLWSLAPAQKLVKNVAGSNRPMMKFESGYTVETVFDGSKLGIEPYSVEVSPAGELLLLDSANSNVYRISLPLSRYSRPKLVAGSAEGITGHVDGRLREARMYHPKGITMDDRGNIYVADTMNMAIRKISDTGVTTIAGGKWSRGGHMDGPSEDAKFSNDFEVVYMASSCSLLVVDRGNQAIREIQLNFDDCAYQYGSGFPLGLAVLIAAAFFGYMLALLQQRVGAMVSSKEELVPPARVSIPSSYQKPMKPVRPPLIPPENELDKQEEEGVVSSIRKVSSGAKPSVTEMLGSVFSGFRKKSHNHQNHNYHQRQPNAWPSVQQESYEIRDEDEPPPPIETRVPIPRKAYAFMSKDAEKIHHVRHAHSRPHLHGWENGLQQQHHQHHHHQLQQQQQQQQQQQHTYQQHVQQHRQYSSGPQTYYEQSCETTNEIVFGAVQELDKKRKMVEIKAVNYGDPYYEQYGLRSRSSYMGYNNNYY